VTPTAESKNIRLVKVLGSADPVQGDSSRIHQIVWNLLTNAIKFTPKGGKVQVSLGRVGSEVAISVTDDGKGISAAFIPHVFDRFKQEDTGLSRHSGGLGLGLAIVRQLTELHGGRVEARSDGEGKGATFIVHFPVPSSHLPDSRMLNTSTSQFGTERPLQKARIVVLEDDRDARELVVQLLEDAGAKVWACADGESGLRALHEQEDVDLVLSDLGMPGVDGYEFIRRLRVQEAELGRKRVLVVALTALARTEDRQMALLAGFHAHIAKPVNPAELTVVVASALGRTGSSWSG
jgi:CheY-like chemotaxis protein/anti-sigma regulatory factor (Ser/Thr protein kinase)